MKLRELLEVIDPADTVAIFCHCPQPVIKARGNNEQVFIELVKSNSPLLNLEVCNILHGDKHIAIRVPYVQ